MSRNVIVTLLFYYVCLLHNVLRGPGHPPHEEALYILQWCYETAESS